MSLYDGRPRMRDTILSLRRYEPLEVLLSALGCFEKLLASAQLPNEHARGTHARPRTWECQCADAWFSCQHVISHECKRRHYPSRSRTSDPVIIRPEYTPTSCASLMKPVANTPVGLVQQGDAFSKTYAPRPFPGASLTSINSCRGLRSYCKCI